MAGGQVCLPVDDSCATRTRDAVVVCLTQPADATDACLRKEVHGQVAQALLCDHHIRLVLCNVLAQGLDILLFKLEQLSPAQADSP